MITAKVLPEFTRDAILEILQQIELVRNVPIPGQEIEQAKSYLIGNFPLRIQTNSDISAKLAEIQAFNLTRDHWERYFENIKRINSEMVSGMGEKYSLDTPVIVIVGNSEIIQYLKEFTKVSVYSPDGSVRYEIK